MATVGSSTVEVGDWLRCKADNWEGQVVGVDDNADPAAVTLRMNIGPERTVPVTQVYWNTWDSKS